MCAQNNYFQYGELQNLTVTDDHLIIMYLVKGVYTTSKFCSSASFIRGSKVLICRTGDAKYSTA